MRISPRRTAHLGDFERAAGCCRAALAIWPDYPEALCNLGAALQGMGKSAEAVEHLERALELRPNFVVAHSNLGIALRDLGRKDEALEHFRRAVELDRRSRRPRRIWARRCWIWARPRRPCRTARRRFASIPNSAVLHHNLGNTLRVLERLVDAKVSYLEALAARPETGLVECPSRPGAPQGRPASDALVWLKKAVELEPGNVDFWQWLAELHDEMEESAESIPCWERVVALDPDRASAHLSLGWALQDESRFDEAREHYDAAIQLQPDFAAAYLNLGGLQEELGDMAAAERSFRTALEKQPAMRLPHARLATLLRSKLPEADLAALEERLKDDKLAEGPRGQAAFCAGPRPGRQGRIRPGRRMPAREQRADA